MITEELRSLSWLPWIAAELRIFEHIRAFERRHRHFPKVVCVPRNVADALRANPLAGSPPFGSRWRVMNIPLRGTSAIADTLFSPLS